MANSVTIPQKWSVTIIDNLRKSLAGANLWNTKWEGEIKKLTDRVNIVNFVGSGGLKSYTAKQAVSPDDVKTVTLQLVIDQLKYVAFDIDKSELQQNIFGESLMNRCSQETIYKANRTIDSWLLSSYSEVSGANIVGGDSFASAIELSKNNVHENIVGLKERIRERDANGMLNIVVPTWICTLVEQAVVNTIQDARVIENGGMNYRFTFAGVNFFESTNSPAKYTAGTGSTLDGALTETAVEIDTVSGSNFSSSGGYAEIDGGAEIIHYTGKSTNKLTGVTRGMFNTIPTAHLTGKDIKPATDFYYPVLMTNPDQFGTWAMQLNEATIVEPDLYFTLLFKGLFLYGKKVTQPKAGALLYAKKSS